MTTQEVGLRVAVKDARAAAVALRGTRSDVAALGDEAERTARKGSGLSVFSKIGGIIGGAAKVGIAGLLGVGAAAVGVGIKASAMGEQAEIAFTTMLGSGDKAKSFLTELRGFAEDTPFEFPDLQTAASSLISVGVEADKVIPIMTTLGNSTAGMGTGADGVKRATVALQQMNAAGRITGEDLNQLRDAGVNVYGALAAATGKSQEEVMALAAAGKLGRRELDQLMAGLESGAGFERFDGLMEKQSLSLVGRWATLVDTTKQGLAGIVDPWKPLLGDALGGITSTAKGLFTTLAARSAELAVHGPAALDKVGDAGRRAVQLVRILGRAYGDGQVTAEGLAGTMQRAGVVIRQGVTGAQSLVGAFRDGQVDAGGFAGTMQGIGAGLASIGDSVRGADVGAAMTSLGDALPAVSTGLQVTGVVTGFLADHLDTLAAWMPVIAAGFLVWKGAAIAANLALAAGVPLRIAEVVANSAHTTALRANTAALGGNTAAENVSTIARVRSAVATTASTIASKVARGAVLAWTGVQWLLNAALSANPIGLIVLAIAALVAGVVWAYKNVDWFREAVDKGWAALKTFGGWVKDIGQQVQRWLIEKLILVISKIKEVAGKIASIPGVGALIEAVGGEVPGRARGGPVAAGQPYVVGERRPELFVPDTAGTIIPSVPDGPGADEQLLAGTTLDGRPLVVQLVTPDGRVLAEETLEGVRAMEARA